MVGRHITIPIRERPDTLSAVHLRRLRALGPGSMVKRHHVAEVCPSRSAANQWIDKMTKRGVLVPVGWGEYHVAGRDALAATMWPQSPHYQRLVAWAESLPTVLHRDVSFLGLRIWRETELAVWHPVPVVPLPVSNAAPNLPPQLGAVEYSPHRVEDWFLALPGGRVTRVPVPSRLDACILLGSNADPRWQEASKAMFDALSRPEQRRAVVDMRRIRRYNGVAYRTRAQVRGPDPIVRLPGWWRLIHEEAVSFLMRSVYAR